MFTEEQVRNDKYLPEDRNPFSYYMYFILPWSSWTVARDPLYTGHVICMWYK